MTEPEKQALTLRLRQDPRVMAALHAKGGSGGMGAAGARLSSQELAQLGYQVPAGWTLVGNQTPRSGRTDFEQMATLQEPDPWWAKLPVYAGAGLLGAGVAGAAGVGPLASHSALPVSAGVDGSLPGISGETLGALQGSVVPSYTGAGAAAGTIGAGAASDAIRRAAANGGVPTTPSRSLLDSITSPGGITSLASLIPLLMANHGTSAAEQAQMDQANKLAAITEARMRRVDPLHQAVTQLAFSRLPDTSRNGIALTPVDLPK